MWTVRVKSGQLICEMVRFGCTNNFFYWAKWTGLCTLSWYYMCCRAQDDSPVQLLRCWAVIRREIPSITIIYNKTHYLPASKHPIYTICNELKSDEKNQDLFELQHDCQVHFHLWKPFTLRDVRDKFKMKKPSANWQWQFSGFKPGIYQHN